jgi:DNA-binding GntR family transcriptional regulator
MGYSNLIQAARTQLMNASPREPVYALIARELTASIASGEVGIGQRLPTELELARRYKVSRHTAREALRRIDGMGLVERRQGSGTRVKAMQPPARFNRAVQTIEDLLDYGNQSRLLVLRARRAPAPAAVARLLQVDPGTDLVQLSAERFQQQWPEPIALTEVHIVVRRDTEVRELLDLRQSIFALLRLVELRRLDRVEQTFSAALATAAQARRLGIPRGAPVLIAQRRYYGAEGVLLMLALSTHRADRYAYNNVLTREAGNPG